jgi:acyl transferase domain-containing protein
MPLAIVGMGCRLPGADGLDAYWRLIVEGKSTVREVPAELMDPALYYDPQVGLLGKSYSLKASLLDSHTFDANRYPIARELREAVDTSHLLMAGVVADAFKQAGWDPFNLPTTNSCVFIGHGGVCANLRDWNYKTNVGDALYLLNEVEAFRDLPADVRATFREECTRRVRSEFGGSGKRGLRSCMMAGTVAKAFGLSGSWLALNSACASSLHALLLGARALQLGHCDMAVVGGASEISRHTLVQFSQAQALSPSGTRPFDADADGLVTAEGYVAVVMKTLERALADGDPIQAVVRGMGVASDGRGKSLWAPRKEGQIRAMHQAYRGGLDISKLQVMEAHGTGTQLGDLTELQTIAEVLGPKIPAGKRIAVSSVKANIGHTLEAAGVTGLIKTVLCIQNKTIPPAINIRSLSPKIDWANVPYYIPRSPESWEAPAAGEPRRAAVNAFGIGGLNMHVVLDEFTEAAKKLVSVPRSSPGQAAGTPAAKSSDDNAVAIVGLGCLFPHANSLPKFWEMLQKGTDAKSLPTEKAWTKRALAETAQPPVGGFITDFEYNWRKHKIPPKQLAEADPLQFMLLEASEQALLDYGFKGTPEERERCGVVVGTEIGGDFGDQLEMGLRLPELEFAFTEILRERGISADKIQRLNAEFGDVLKRTWPALKDETGSFTSSTLASRVTKTLDLFGGAVAIDCGSTSALSAISVCCDMLLGGDNDLMICASGQRRVSSNGYLLLETGNQLTKTKPRHVLDAQYDGVVPGEGVGVVVLKRLADARRDGDRIHAVIRGIGTAQHASQAEAIRMATERAFAQSGLNPADVRFLEMDTDEQLSERSQELQVLAQSHAGAGRRNPLSLGTPVAQFGHLGGGSGMPALFKGALEIENRQLLPEVGLESPNAALGGWAGSVEPQRAVSPIKGRALGGVASWSNGLATYVILEQGAPVEEPAEEEVVKGTAAPVATAVSATSAPQLAWAIYRSAGANVEQVVTQIAADQRNLQAAWQQGTQRRFADKDRYRLAIVADSAASLEKKLQLAATQLSNTAAREVLEQQGIFFREVSSQKPRVVFAFPGQGSQYEGMLKELVRDVPAAAKMLAEIDATMTRLGYPTFSELAWSKASPLGSDVWVTQISMLLADAIVLAALRDRGITPDVVLGHSYGEFPALYSAGAWDLETTIKLTRARCDGISSVAAGQTGMLATDAPLEKIESLLSGRAGVYISNCNAPDQTVIGGRKDQLEQLAQALQNASHQSRILAVPAAFHTPLMDGASNLLKEALRAIEIQRLKVPLVSTVTNAEVRNPSEIRRNLADQLTTPVRYWQLISQLAEQQPTVFVEVGPQQVLTRLNRRIAKGNTSLIAADNPKNPGPPAILCVEALIDCLGRSSSEVTPAANERSAPVSVPPKINPPKPMNDSIPHFDATERRRNRMRGAAPTEQTPAAALKARPAPPAVPAKPAPQPAPPVAVAPPAAAPAAITPAAKAAPSKLVDTKELESFLVKFVVERTGYPAEVVDLDGDLEADLGIDSIKKAHLFSELNEYFDVSGSISTDSKFSLDDFKTLRHVLNFLQSNSTPTASIPAAAPAAVSAPVAPPVVPSAPPAPAAPVAQPAATTATKTIDASELESFLVNFVVERTGYPAEVVDLDGDLEADLGIDSIKKAHLFSELNEYFDVSGSVASDSKFSLDDFRTLRHVLNFLKGSQTSSAAPAVATAAPIAVAPVAPAAPAPVAAVAPPAAASAKKVDTAGLETFLVNFVVERTGYPAEVVDLDGDLEADLGIDSIKKAHLFSELNDVFDVAGSVSSNSKFSLDDFRTLRHVLNFLEGAQASSPAVPTAEPVATVARAVEPVAPSVPAAPVATAAGPSSKVNVAELETFLVNFVVERTGYPAEVVDLDGDLEADLGIDSIKKAHLFSELNDVFDVAGSASANTKFSLDDFRTLRHVLDFLSGLQGNTTQAAPVAAAPIATTPAPAHVKLAANTSATRLAGTPYEMGWEHGRRYQNEIRRILRNYVDRSGGQPGELPGQANVENFEKILSADELDELQGMADAAEVSLGNLLVHQFALAAEFGYDSTIGRNLDGQLVHAIRQPHPLQAVLKDAFAPTMQVRVPTGRIAYVAASLIGTANVSAGANAAGIAVTGQRCSGLVREILESAVDLDSATAIVNARRAGKDSWSLHVSHGRANKALAVDFNGHSLNIQTVAPSMTEGVEAKALAESLVAGTAGNIPEAVYARANSANAASNGHGSAATYSNGSHGNHQQQASAFALVMEPSSGRLWFGGDDGANVRQIATSDLPTTQSRPAIAHQRELPPLPANQIAQRFSLSVREAPLGNIGSAEPTWRGPAILIGNNPAASALQARLLKAGLTVYEVPVTADIDSAVAKIEQICQGGAVPHMFITTASDAASIDPNDEAAWNRHRHETMVLPFFVCQKWVTLALEGKWLDQCSVVATTALGGDFGFAKGAEIAQGGSLSGLLKAIFVEFGVIHGLKNLCVKVIDTKADAPAEEVVDHVFRELASKNMDFEVAYAGGRRFVPDASARAPISSRPANVRPGSTWVITGGARGITAACALELGRQFNLKLHLIGSSPVATVDPAWHSLDAAGLQQLKNSVMISARKAGKPFAAAWERVQKDIEIDHSLRAFAAAGVSVTYHACDVSNREALAKTLAQVRQESGPIAGILHGAGIEHSCRFDKKTRDLVGRMIGVKIDGAANLIALTKRDPIRHFVGFGSVSGRFGGFGQADYCLANEMLAKLLGTYRRERPWVQTVTFHWHAWDDVGMAVRPGTKEVLQTTGDLLLMPVKEGVAHLLREVVAGSPEPEVVITESRHWQKFASMTVQNTGGQFPKFEVATKADAETKLTPPPKVAAAPLTKNIRREASGGTVADIVLDPTREPFLIQHRLRNKPLFPIVVALQGMLEAASAESSQQVIGFRDVEAVDGLLFHTDEPTTIQATAKTDASGKIVCTVQGDLRNRAGKLIQKDRPYVRAVADCSTQPASLRSEIPSQDGEWYDVEYPEGAAMYHGPIFRGLVSGTFNAQGGTTIVTALPLQALVGRERASAWTIPSVVFDSAMYACGSHLWLCDNSLMGIPKSIGEFQLGRAPKTGEACRVNLACRERNSKDAKYDFDILGANGDVIMRVRGCTLVVIDRGMS